MNRRVLYMKQKMKIVTTYLANFDRIVCDFLTLTGDGELTFLA